MLKFFSKWSISPAGLWNLFEGKSQAWSNLHFFGRFSKPTICTGHNPGWWKTLWVAGCQSDLFCHYLLSLVPCSQQRREKHYSAQCKDLLLVIPLKMGTNIIKCYCIRWWSRNICRMLYNFPINMFTSINVLAFLL